jgi:hypothetical protein
MLLNSIEKADEIERLNRVIEQLSNMCTPERIERMAQLEVENERLKQENQTLESKIGGLLKKAEINRKKDVEYVDRMREKHNKSETERERAESEAEKFRGLSSLLNEENRELKATIRSFQENNNSLIYTALIKAKEEMPAIRSDQTITIAQVIKAVTPVLTKNNLCIFQTFEANTMVTTLAHHSGQCIQSKVELPKMAENIISQENVDRIFMVNNIRLNSYCAIIGLETYENVEINTTKE